MVSWFIFDEFVCNTSRSSLWPSIKSWIFHGSLISEELVKHMSTITKILTLRPFKVTVAPNPHANALGVSGALPNVTLESPSCKKKNNYRVDSRPHIPFYNTAHFYLLQTRSNVHCRFQIQQRLGSEQTPLTLTGDVMFLPTPSNRKNMLNQVHLHTGKYCPREDI